MKAIQYSAYGGLDVLGLHEVADPGPPRRGEALVRVAAASINPVDGKVRRGELKFIAGGRFPKRPGLDFSGVVEALGEGVTGMAVGDAVFGGARSMSEGAFAERILVRAASIAHKPKSLGHVAAAGAPTVAIAALQSFRDIVKVRAGDRILVNGCTGGVGLYALQLARKAGAQVFGVCGADGISLARAFGADDAVDYRSGEIARIGELRAILELSGRLGFEASEKMLQENGVYVDFSPSPAGVVGNAVANPLRRRKHVFAMTAATSADLQLIAAQIDAGELRAAPTQAFDLDRFAEAFAAAEGGGVRGKVVVRISADD